MQTSLKAYLALGLAAFVAAVPVDSTDSTDATISAASSTDDDYNSKSNCVPVTFVASGTAQVRNVTGVPTDSLSALVNFALAAPVTTVSGPQNLTATYCKPTVGGPNNDRIEVFFGSITADRNGWSAQGGVGTTFPEYQPERYSWVRFANNLGYHTLAFDRLGTGTSSKPDAFTAASAPYEQVLYADVARQIRAGAPQLGRSFKDLIYVGNSYGSQLGAGIAGEFPNAYTSYILTGFSANPQQDFLGVAMVGPAPAQVVDPARFGTDPPGYLTTSSEVGRTNSFFGSKKQVAFDDTVADLFFKRKNTVTVGQFVSVYADVFNGKGFKGRVLTLTGEQDQAFCGPGSPVIGPASCGPQLKQAGALFPDADYNYQSVDKTGHAIQLHYSSQKVYAIAHLFLAGREFKGGPPA